jgi:hypothetical protein
MDLFIVQRAIWTACLTAEVLLIVAIFARSLARRYRFFLASLIVEVVALGMRLFHRWQRSHGEPCGIASVAGTVKEIA